MLQVLKEKVTSLSDNRKSALAADVEDIVYTSTGDISIYYDEKGNAGLATLWPLIVQVNQSWVPQGRGVRSVWADAEALQNLYHFSSL